MKLRSLVTIGLALAILAAIVLFSSIRHNMPHASAIPNSSPLLAQASIQNGVTNFEGILFETVVPEQEWVVPVKDADAYTPVRLGIRITNTTPNPIRVTRPGGLIPQVIKEPTRVRPSSFELLDPEEIIRAGQWIDLPAGGSESDYPVVLPGESITLFLEGRLYWHSSRSENLAVDGSDGYEIGWSLSPLQANADYLLWMSYQGIGTNPGSRYGNYSVDIFELNVQVWNYPPQPPHLHFLVFDVYADGQEPLNETSRRTRIEGVVGNIVQTPPVRIRLVSQ